MDMNININELLSQLQRIAPEFAENKCMINKTVCNLADVEKMSCREFWLQTKSIMPSRLYKYFPNKENEEHANYSIQALKNNTVHLQSPSRFDDVYDSAINIDYFDYQRIELLEYCNRCEIGLQGTETIDDLYRILSEYVENEVKMNGDFNSIIRKPASCEIEELSNTVFVMELELGHKQGIQTEDNIRRIIEKEFSNYQDKLKNTFCVSCFTTTPYSQLMWSSYADEHRGFCVEYTIDRTNTDYTDVYQNLFPMIYCKTRPNVTERMMSYKDRESTTDSLMDLYFYGTLRKCIDWAYQDEWRLLLPAGFVKDNDGNVKFFKETKVFIGNRMIADKRREIIKICKEKNIPYVGMVCKQNAFEIEECKGLCENCRLSKN